MAEEIAWFSNHNSIAVISGIGVRDYYRKNGYELSGTYMVKKFRISNPAWEVTRGIIVLLAIVILLKVFVTFNPLNYVWLAPFQAVGITVTIGRFLGQLFPTWWDHKYRPYLPLSLNSPK
jgi:hypothetical protein